MDEDKTPALYGGVQVPFERQETLICYIIMMPNKSLPQPLPQASENP